MKKSFLVFISFILILSLCGCSMGSTPPPSDSAADAEFDESAAYAYIPPTELITDPTEFITEPTEPYSEATEVDEFSLGHTEGNVYTNTFLSLGVSLPSEWSMYTDEEISTINGVSSGSTDEIEQVSALYGMYANDLSGNNINISFMPVSDESYLTMSNEELSYAAMEGMLPILEQMGAVNVVPFVSTVTIDEKEFASCDFTFESNLTPCYRKMFFIRCNDYIATVTLTAFSEAVINNTINKFYTI